MADIVEVIEEAEEAIEGAEDGLDEAGETVDDLPEAEREEFEEEIEETRDNLEELTADKEEFSKWAKLQETLKSFAKFVLRNMAIGAILYGVNIGLSKLVKLAGDEKERKAYKRKLDIVKAISQLIKTESNICKKVEQWLKIHKDDTVEIEGITVPLEAIFHKYLGPISDAVDQALTAAKRLQTKIGDKVSWNVPTADDIGHLINASSAFYTAFSDFKKFADDHSSKFPVLKTLPLTQDDLDTLNYQLEEVKKMPLY